ncbi:TPA: hypothetical protein ACHK0L_005182, partial [Escherichia coli]
HPREPIATEGLPLCTDLISPIIGRRSANSQYDRHIDRFNANNQIFILTHIAKSAFIKTYIQE